MRTTISKEDALKILQKHNKEPFHILHGLTVEGVMKWFANEEGFADEADYWGIVGLLHDIDFEEYPNQHCIKAPELLKDGGVGDDVIHAVCSHGYNLTVDVKPEHHMEKVLYAVDELTGLVWASAKMRPSQSVGDMELKSLKKKFKDKKFAAGCSRDVIKFGAQLLDWELDTLLEKTILAMRSCEESVNQQMQNLS
jgi:predicted hydrolase (HD superfamily)